MEWHHPQSPRTKKFKTTPSAGKLMITVFWDIGGVILVDVMARGETINSDAYIRTLQKLKERYRRLRPNRNPGGMLIQHDNACPHTSLRTQEAITKFGWTLLPQPPHIVLIWRRQISIFLGHWRMHCVGHGLKMTRAWFVPWGHGYVNRERAGTGKACMPLFRAGVRP